jgi:hypothetical protein
VGVVKIVGDEARRITLHNLVRAGCGVHEAMEKVGRQRGWYQKQRTLFPAWAAQVDELRFARGPLGTNKWERDDRAIHEVELDSKAGGFEQFCKDYLNTKLFWHQLQWIDILEGREPRNLHPAQVYEPGDPRMIIINTPPDHAKSMTLSQLYVVYLLCTNPDIRVKLVSKSDRLAQQFMYNIQRFLTHPDYAKLQNDFGPPEGYKAAADKWRASMLYLGGNQRTASEADPNVQALGLGQQIYGTRSDARVLKLCASDIVRSHHFGRLRNFGERPRVRETHSLDLAGSEFARRGVRQSVGGRYPRRRHGPVQGSARTGPVSEWDLSVDVPVAACRAGVCRQPG